MNGKFCLFKRPLVPVVPSMSYENPFYGDNCLQSFPLADEAKSYVHNLRIFLTTAGFEICQWAMFQFVIKHLLSSARSESSELWQGQVSLAFVVARSIAAPKRQTLMPRLSGAQLAVLVKKSLQRVIY